VAAQLLGYVLMLAGELLRRQRLTGLPPVEELTHQRRDALIRVGPIQWRLRFHSRTSGRHSAG
jgi:hypothetical protein